MKIASIPPIEYKRGGPPVRSSDQVGRLRKNLGRPPQELHPLVAALSSDGGRSWGKAGILSNETGRNQLSNHDVSQLPDGRILVYASHYRAQVPACSDLDMFVFDEEWLG